MIRKLALFVLNAVLVVASVWLTMRAIEWGSQAWYDAHGGAGLSRKEFRLKRPPPYRNSPYFSAAFIRESLKMPGAWKTPPGTRLVIPADFAGRYAHVRDGLRQTTDQPSAVHHTLWLFGGSTIFDVEVPDEDTVASELQRLINGVAPGTWRVVNAGAITVTSAQELERLKTLAISAGDLVVFYDGVNDITQGIFYNNPDGWIVGTNRELAAREKSRRTILSFVNEKAHAIMPHFFFLFERLPPPALPEHLRDPGQLAALTRRATEKQLASIAAAADYARSRGAAFSHFLQPNLFSHPVLTDYEATLAANPELVYTGLQTAFAAGNAPLRQNVARLRALGVDSHDLTALFDDRPPGEEYFLDFCHVTEVANGRIAQALLGPLRERLLQGDAVH